MKKTAKWISALLVVFLLLSTIQIASAQSPADDEDALKEQWLYCLKVHNWMAEKLLWAFDYADAYTEDATWENLLKARAACSAARLAFQLVELNGRDMAQEQYLSLMEKNIEAEVVLLEYENLETLRQQRLVTVEHLETLLLTDVFLSPTANKLSDWLGSCRKQVNLESQYDCLTTNYLLLQLGETQWGEIPTQFPVIGAFCGDWSTVPEQLEEDCAAVLDALESQEEVDAVYYGISELTLKLVNSAAAGEISLVPYLQSPSQVPGCFPFPAWLPEDAMFYYQIFDSDTQKNRLPLAGETITLPVSCYIPCDSISLEEVKDYAETLKALGLTVDTAWNEEKQTYTVLAQSGPCIMGISWTQDETALLLKDPVACLIPELFLSPLLKG